MKMFCKQFSPILSFLFIVELFFLCSRESQAYEVLRPQSIFELGQDVSMEEAPRLEGVKIAWVNFSLVRKDFPQIASLSNEEIKAWLIEQFAFVGSQQNKLNGIRNTNIPLVPSITKHAFRPPSWDRSAILEAYTPEGKNIGLVDIKGFGWGDKDSSRSTAQVSRYQEAASKDDINGLRIHPHSDGLMSLGEAIAEVSRQQAIQQLLEMKTSTHETVEAYALFMLPFQILKDNEQRIPAGMLLRQAQLYRNFNLYVPSGIYSDNAGLFQRTSSDTAVDFGGTILEDERLKHHFGPLDDEKKDPQYTKAWSLAHEAALRAMEGSPHIVSQHLENVLQALQEAYTSSKNRELHMRNRNALIRLVNKLQEKQTPFEAIAEKVKQYKYSLLSFDELKNLLNVDFYHSLDDSLRRLETRQDTKTLRLFVDGALKSEHAAFRQAALKKIAKIKGPQYRQFINSIITQKAEDLVERKDSESQIKGIDLFFYRNDPESLSILKNLLKKDLHYATRQNLIKAIGERKDSASLDLLMEYFIGAGEDNKFIIIELLNKRWNLRVQTFFKKIVLSPKESFNIQHMALERLRNKSSLPLSFISQIIGTNSPILMQTLALDLLNKKWGPAALEIVLKCLNSNRLISLQKPILAILMSKKDNLSLQALKKIRSDNIKTFLENKDSKTKENCLQRESALHILSLSLDNATLEFIEKEVLDSSQLISFLQRALFALEQTKEYSSVLEQVYGKLLATKQRSVQEEVIRSILRSAHPKFLKLLETLDTTQINEPRLRFALHKNRLLSEKPSKNCEKPLLSQK